MKKLLGITFLVSILSVNANAKILFLECVATKNNENYERNERIFDTKKGTYINIKKRDNEKIRYTIYQLSSPDLDYYGKFKFRKNDTRKLMPYNKADHTNILDVRFFPNIYWGTKSDGLNLGEELGVFDGLITHKCKENKDKELNKKEFKKIKEISKTTSPFEIISDFANDFEKVPFKLAQKVIDKEKEINQNIKNKHDIDHSFIFEDRSGNKISKNSDNGLWKKFWGTVGWVLYEHGDDIFNLAVDLKYGTSQTTQTPKMYCTSQRVGNSKIVHTTCRQR